ncbi:MAG: peptidylprolyl isomerase [Planctomycetota bacterium]
MRTRSIRSGAATMGLGDQHDKGAAGIRITARRGRWVMAWLCGVLIWVGGVSAWAQEELPGDDPAAWLVEASVQARRVSGVGEELTYALQTKGALLANIAAAQRDLGEGVAAQENETIVRLCLRALAHDGEDGWVRAAQVWAEHDRGNESQVALLLDEITKTTERDFVSWVIQGATPGDEPETANLSTGFKKQLTQVERLEWVRTNARSVSAHGTTQDTQAWVEALDDPAERAWASLGVAQGLLDPSSRDPRSAEPAMTAEPIAVTIVETAVVSEPEPQPEPEVLEDAQAEPRPVSDPAVLVAEEPVVSDESVADLVQAPTADTEPEPAEGEPRPEPATSETPTEDTLAPAATSIDAQKLASAIEETPAVAVPILVTPEVETSSELEPSDLQPAIEAPVTDAPASGVMVAPLVPDLSTLADPAAVLTTQVSPGVFDVEFTTTTGAFTVRVHREWAPVAADRFHDLAAAGFYHNQRFFRVVPGFVVQWGIHGFPDVAAAWRPQTLADEPRIQPNRRGTIAFAAATQPNTRATQVFINLTDNAFLDDLGFVPFGEIVEGMDVVESLFGGYGETPSSQQREIQLQGNTFLDARYPELDSIISAELSPTE